MRPAIVRYIAESNEKFTAGACYEAYFLEYWEGERNSLHVKGDDGKITDFNPFSDFEVLSDEDGVLNTYEAIVRCHDGSYDNDGLGITLGKEYLAIGRDKDGMYLVMDNTYCCYYYPSGAFEVVDDPHGILG